MNLKILLLLSALTLSASPYAGAQWIGSDERPLEPSKAQVSYLGADVTKSTTPGGPSAVVRVYGEGYPTPPVYPVKPEQISSLKLDTAQEAALKKEFPDFATWTLADYGTNVKYFPFSEKQLPYAINWDHNGKNTPIKVITGHDETQNYLVIFKPEGKSYKAIRRDAGFIHTTGIPHRILPMLRMLKRGTTVRILDEDNPAAHVLPHDAFAYFDVWISSGIPSERQPQLSGNNTIYYFHEGLFPLNRADIKGFRVTVAKTTGKKSAEDAVPSPGMMTALANFNKDFKIWTSRDYPQNSASRQYAVRQDFNGDGIDDMVVAGHDNDANMVLEIISRHDGYNIKPLGQSSPCYSKARERNTKLPLKPSHALFLYRKRIDYTSIAPRATKNLWEHKDSILLGIRMLNTCLKPRSDAQDFDPSFEYSNWRPWPGSDKDSLYIYAESDDQIICPGGIDHCGFELIPPAGDNGDKSK